MTALARKSDGDAQLHYALGSVYYLESNLDEAERKLRPSFDPTRSQAGRIRLATRDKGNVGEAGRIFESVLKRHPDHALL